MRNDKEKEKNSNVMKKKKKERKKENIGRQRKFTVWCHLRTNFGLRLL